MAEPSRRDDDIIVYEDHITRSDLLSGEESASRCFGCPCHRTIGSSDTSQ